MKLTDRPDLLATFVRIAETGSLTAAARSLELSQPSISRQLRSLEEALGARLIHRTTHRMALTETGEVVVAEARRILADLQGLAERVRGAEADISGLLRVIAPVALGQGRLVDLAARLVRRHPGLRFDWMLTDRALDPVAEGADCVIRAGAISEPDLVARPLAEIRRVLVASPELARDDPAEIDGLPGLASRPFHGALIPLIDGQGRPRPLATEIVFASDNILAVHRAALMGLGVALLPQWMVEADLTAGRLVRLAPELEGKPLTISLGYPAGRHRPARLTAFIEALREDLSAAQGFARPPA